MWLRHKFLREFYKRRANIYQVSQSGSKSDTKKVIAYVTAPKIGKRHYARNHGKRTFVICILVQIYFYQLNHSHQ